MTPTAFIFFQEYGTLSKEYENENKGLRKASDDDDNIDYFTEYIKPFYIKKPKVIKT